MPRYYAVAEKNGKTFEGFVEFDTPVERMMQIFHSHGASVDFYTNVKKDSQYVESGLEEGKDNGKNV
jgi:hypothetical protein